MFEAIMAITEQQVEAALSQFSDPYISEENWHARQVIKNIKIEGNDVLPGYCTGLSGGGYRRHYSQWIVRVPG